MGVMRRVDNLVGKCEETRPLGRPKNRLRDSIKKFPKEVGWDHVDWINLAQNRVQQLSLVNMVMKLRVL
jgi:hypothetical protein